LEDYSGRLCFNIDQFEEGEFPAIVSAMCSRHFGIGADGVILVQNSNTANLRMRIFNSDGSEAEACGNGLRCFSKYAIERNMVDIKSLPEKDICLSIETMAGIREAKPFIAGNKVTRVEVSMGIPEFRAGNIPISTMSSNLISEYNNQILEQGQGSLLSCSLPVLDTKLQLWLISMGNPHAVNFISQSTAKFPLSEYGPLVEHDPFFPKHTNFEIAKVLEDGKIEARIWERGVGETLSCGSGACAIAVASKVLGYTGNNVDIILPGGILSIFWDCVGQVKLAGPVEEVFTGKYVIHI